VFLFSGIPMLGIRGRPQSFAGSCAAATHAMTFDLT
jgi:hypothetical protein